MNFDFSKVCKNVKTDYPLSETSSMKTGGKVKTALFPSSEEELCECLKIVKQSEIKYYIIGNSSNVLFPDEGINGAVIFTVGLSKFSVCSEFPSEIEHSANKAKNDGKTIIYAQCGVMMTAFSLFAKKNSLAGIEFMYGIPGTLGGGVFMNAGAYGGEISDHFLFAKVLSADDLSVSYIDKISAEFSYRESVFSKDKSKIILGAYFALPSGNCDEIEQKCEKNMVLRKEKQPLEYPSCGSAFKRPEGYFASALIENAGLRGKNVGGAFVSEKHTGFIINKGNATSKDVLSLIELVKSEVYKNSGVLLEPEIRILK